MELPRAIESEQAVLGALISYPKVTNVVMEELRHDDFYNTRHKKIFREMQELYRKGLVLDMATLGDNIKYHCDLIKDRAMKRNIIEVSRELIKKAYDNQVKARDMIGEGAEELYKLLQ